MSNIQQPESNMMLPLKSVAGALLFSVLLGPVGLLYSSMIGGTLLTFLTFNVWTHEFNLNAIIALWLISCVWSVGAANYYNKKLLRKKSVS
jgi:hypothetical protein